MCPELLGKLKIMFQFVLPSPRIWSEMPLLLLLLLAALLLLLVVLLLLLVSQDLSWAAFARSKNWVRQVSVWQLTLFATSREIKSSPLRAFFRAKHHGEGKMRRTLWYVLHSMQYISKQFQCIHIWKENGPFYPQPTVWFEPWDWQTTNKKCFISFACFIWEMTKGVWEAISISSHITKSRWSSLPLQLFHHILSRSTFPTFHKLITAAHTKDCNRYKCNWFDCKCSESHFPASTLSTFKLLH